MWNVPCYVALTLIGRAGGVKIITARPTGISVGRPHLCAQG